MSTEHDSPDTELAPTAAAELAEQTTVSSWVRRLRLLTQLNSWIIVLGNVFTCRPFGVDYSLHAMTQSF